MLERESVAAAIASTLDQARAGRGGCLFILGDAGLGKTACLREARSLAIGMRVATGRADPMESALPFGLMSQVTAELGGADLLAPPGAAVTPLDARIGRFVTTLRWMQEQAATPVVLTVDDLHWSDQDSLALLCFLIRRIAAVPVAVIGAMRAWPSDAQDHAAALAHDGSARLARLEPLSQEAASTLLAERVGRPVPAEVGERAWTACAGNPLLLEQVAAVLERGEDASALLALGGRQIGDRLMLARFAGLNQAGLAVARAAAVLGGRFSSELVGPVAAMSAEQADQALDALARSGLIGQATAGGLEFVHPLFRQALYEETSAPLRARLHARAFSVLRSRGLDEQACEHALPAQLSGVPEAISLLENTGRADLSRGALAGAAERLAGAVRLAGGRAQPGLLLAWGEASLWSGQPHDAIAAMERVLTCPGVPAAAQVNAHRTMAIAHTSAGAHQAAAHAYKRAFRSAPADEPELAAGVLVDHALAVWLTAGPVAALPLARRARRIARRASPQLQRRADLVWGFTALQAGDPGSLHLVSQAAAPLLEEPTSDLADLASGMGSTLLIYVLCRNMAGQPAESMVPGRVLLAAAEQVGAVQTLASAWVVHSYTLFRVGRLPEALDHISRAAGVADLVPMIEPYAAVGQAHILLHLGRLDEAEQSCARVEATASLRGEWNAMLFLFDARGQRLLREGDARAASDLYLQAEQVRDRLGLDEPCLVPWARHAVTAHVRSGRLADAERLTAWLEECADRLPCRWPLLAAITGRALLAEAAGERQESEACYEKALALHAELALPIERVETLLDLGAMLRRSGRISQARQVLGEAVGAAEAVGAEWLAGLAARELAIAGGRRRQAPTRELTGQELRVATLAAAGKSNAELARQLSVSVNTVETHLRHIYAKIGVRSRLQLAHYLTEKAAAEPLP